MEMNYLSEFILSHPKLTFLGLMFNNCCLNEMFINPNHIHYQKNLTVSIFCIFLSAAFKNNKSTFILSLSKNNHFTSPLIKGL